MNNESLTEPGDQLDLPQLDLDAIRTDVWTDLGTSEGQYTGVVLHNKHPQIYEAIMRLIASKMGIRAIARLLGVHVKTVMGVRDREPVAIATLKKDLAGKLLGVADLALETAQERLENLDGTETFKDLLIGLGILTDKGLLLSGDATSRVEIVTADPGHDDYLSTLAAIDAEASEMDLGTETPEQKGALPAHESAGLVGETPHQDTAGGPLAGEDDGDDDNDQEDAHAVDAD